MNGTPPEPRPAFPNAHLPLWPVFVCVLALLLTEAGLKQWAIQALSPGTDRLILPGLLHLGFTLNTGMAWGLLGGLTLPLALLRVGVGAALLLVIGKRWGHFSSMWPLALLAAGALGNGLDGLIRGAVVDYLTSPLLDAASRAVTGRPFPIFNLSDVMICAGVIWLLGHTILREQRAGHFASLSRDTSKES